MKIKIIKQLLFFFAITGPLFSYCQETNHTKVLGTWAFIKFEFTKPTKDSLALINNSKGMIVTFEKENKVIMKQKTGNAIKIIRNGTYTLSEDGKRMFQNDAEAQILSLTDEELVMKVIEEGCMIYFKRVQN